MIYLWNLKSKLITKLCTNTTIFEFQTLKKMKYSIKYVNFHKFNYSHTKNKFSCFSTSIQLILQNTRFNYVSHTQNICFIKCDSRRVEYKAFQ